MRSTLKAFLYLPALDFIVLCAASVGLMLHQDVQAAPNAAQVQVDVHRWADNMAGARPSVNYEPCAREVRADYSDDPVKADAWIRTSVTDQAFTLSMPGTHRRT